MSYSVEQDGGEFLVVDGDCEIVLSGLTEAEAREECDALNAATDFLCSNFPNEVISEAAEAGTQIINE